MTRAHFRKFLRDEHTIDGVYLIRGIFTMQICYFLGIGDSLLWRRGGRSEGGVWVSLISIFHHVTNRKALSGPRHTVTGE